MSRENPLWGAPHIHGELLKLGITIGETSVAKYMVRPPKPPSQTWRTFLDNHVKTMVSVDFFTVPTIRFQVLYVRLIGSIRRECLDHIIVFNEAGLRRTLSEYFSYYHGTRPPPLVGEGRTGTTEGAPAGVGPGGSDSSGRGTAPSLRATGGLKRYLVHQPTSRFAHWRVRLVFTTASIPEARRCPSGPGLVSQTGNDR
jgi:hypothetical protein